MSTTFPWTTSGVWSFIPGPHPSTSIHAYQQIRLIRHPSDEPATTGGVFIRREGGVSNRRSQEVSKIPTSGHGFFVRWRDGRLLGFAHYIDGKKSGLSREYHRGTHFLRRETHWKGGVRHGWDRHFDDKGRPKTVQHFEKGFIPPVIRYRGKATGGATLHKGEGRLYYHAPRRIMRELHLRGVGMTTADVSRLLELDFSEKSGISFNSVGCETALHVEFDKGKVSKVYTLPNGAHCE